jgi:hypothetical protein
LENKKKESYYPKNQNLTNPAEETMDVASAITLSPKFHETTTSPTITNMISKTPIVSKINKLSKDQF